MFRHWVWSSKKPRGRADEQRWLKRLRDSVWVKHKGGGEKREGKEKGWEVFHIPGKALGVDTY